MRILTGILAASMVAGVSTAALAETNGWYLGAEGGANYLPDLNNKIDGTKSKEKNDLGYGLLGSVGYGFGPVRVEEEAGWRQNGVNKLDGNDAKGNTDALTLMTNAYYDFNTGTAFTPYVGAGIGAADVTADNVKVNGVKQVDKGDWGFAYQGIAGVNYAINDALSLNADYRYLRTTDLKIKTEAGLNDKLTYESHGVFVGFTYKFGATPKPTPIPVAAPVPAAAPIPAPTPKPVAQQAIAKSYLVFFDFDKSDITPEAHRIITQAAANAKSSSATSINVTGHTDAAGSEKYNMALSLRRANAVKAELVKQGIPANEIAVVGKGKSEPLVATKDGVREPQNRRVQILLP